MLGRAIVHGRVLERTTRLGLVLGALVGVAERPRLAVVLVDRAAAVAGDVGGRDVGHALQVGYGARELEHAPGALDVDRARLLDREVEGDRGRAVDHGSHAPGDLVVALAEPQARRGQVAGDRDDAAGRRGLHAVQDGAQARVGLGVVGGAHEAVDLVVGGQQAREHGHADEAGGSGEQDRTFGDGHGLSVLLVLVSGVQGGAPPGRGPWAACTDSRRARWTTGRARVAGVRALPLWALPGVEMLKRG